MPVIVMTLKKNYIKIKRTVRIIVIRKLLCMVKIYEKIFCIIEYGPVTLIKNDTLSIFKNSKELFHISNDNFYKETKEFYEFYKNGTCFCKVLKSSLLLLEGK